MCLRNLPYARALSGIEQLPAGRYYRGRAICEGCGNLMVVEDRVLRGFISGLGAGVAMTIPDLILTYLGFTEVLYRDWAAILINGYEAGSLLSRIIGHAGHLLFAGVMGILFAYFVLLTSSRALYFKGVLFSLVIWFSSYVVVSLFQFSPLLIISPVTTVADGVTSMVYGLVLPWLLARLDK